MKTLSIKQPWCQLIALGIKDIENRTWATAHRGRIVLHASLKGIAIDFTPEQKKAIAHLHDNELTWDMQYGAIIGSVEIVDCVKNHPSIWAEKGFAPNGKPIWNWVLKDARMFKNAILNVKGNLSLWDTNITDEFKIK